MNDTGILDARIRYKAILDFLTRKDMSTLADDESKNSLIFEFLSAFFQPFIKIYPYVGEFCANEQIFLYNVNDRCSMMNHQYRSPFDLLCLIVAQ